MNARFIWMIAAAGLAWADASLAADTSATTDKIKAAVILGEVVLTGSEMKTLHEAKEAEEFRVCVKAEKDAAPMKLTYDGQSAVLKPGDCKNVTAKKLEGTPEHALAGSAHIVTTFHRVKEKK